MKSSLLYAHLGSTFIASTSLNRVALDTHRAPRPMWEEGTSCTSGRHGTNVNIVGPNPPSDTACTTPAHRIPKSIRATMVRSRQGQSLNL